MQLESGKPSLESGADFRKILREALESRQRANSAYSLRAFARDLKVSSGRLSEILRGKQGLSLLSARRVAAQIGMRGREQERFCLLVQMECARSAATQRTAEIRLRKYQRRPGQHLALDTYRVIADWYHFAILELCEVEGFRTDAVWIGERLGIRTTLIRGALDRLVRVGLARYSDSGVLEPTDQFTASPDDIPSAVIRASHTQVLQKAMEALTVQSVDDREFGAVLLGFNRKDLARAKRRLRQMRSSLPATLSSGRGKRDSVYCFSFQFYRMDQENKHE